MFCTANQSVSNSTSETVKKIGSYLFRYSDVLGSGNFSTVYSGVDENTGRQVAVKVVRMSSLKSKTALKLLEQQIEILKDLDHANVIKCFDELTSINNCYIITELCMGDLDKKLKEKGKFEEKQISRWVWDVLKGLQYLENNSIIHRDLKLSNVFLSLNGSAKIADFGFAIKSNQKFKGLNIGSPIYMSPEGLIYNQYGPKTDIWALGIMIYELLHGDTPLENCKTEAELKRKVLEPPIYRAKISPQLKKFIESCLKVNETQRFSVSQLLETPYAKRLKYEVEGAKNFKTYSSGYNSTFNSTTELSTGSQNFNRFSIFEEISYDTAVSILHYCRLIHKTSQRIKSQLLSQWLLNVSFQLLKAKISRNHTDKDQYQKLRQVVIEYHNKYQKQHDDFKAEVLICDVLKQCEAALRTSEARQYVSVLLKETKMLRLSMQKRKLEDFGKCSQSKKFLAILSSASNPK